VKYRDIQKMAKNMGINTYQMKKNDMIRIDPHVLGHLEGGK
jgi:hypothetical protein